MSLVSARNVNNANYRPWENRRTDEAKFFPTLCPCLHSGVALLKQTSQNDIMLSFWWNSYTFSVPQGKSSTVPHSTLLSTTHFTVAG